MIDYHIHVLPGLDDGAADMEEAVAIARTLADAGFSEAFCTPHQIKGCYDADHPTVVRRMEELRMRLETVGVDLILYPGSEYYLDEYLLKGLKDCVTFHGSQFLLVEISNHMTVEFILEACYRIRCRGWFPVIAHPERCRALELPKSAKTVLTERSEVRGSRFKQLANIDHRAPNGPSNTVISYLLDIGCRFQGNIGSFAGIYGESVRGRAITYLRGGFYSCLGSDAHNSRNLGEWLAKGLHEIEWDIGSEGLRELLNWVPFSGRKVEPGVEDEKTRGLGLETGGFSVNR